MGRFRKVDTRIWMDEKFMRLSDDAKLLFFCVMTHPNCTALGAFRATVPGLAAEINWVASRCQIAIEELITVGMVEHDAKSAFIGLPNFLKYNRPENPNVVKSWTASLDLVPECQLKALLIERARATAEATGESFLVAFSEAFPHCHANLPERVGETLPEDFQKGMANQEQEPEQEPEQDKDKTDTVGRSNAKKAAMTDLESELMTRWNAVHGVSHMRDMTPGRKRSFKSRLAENAFAENWRDAITIVSKSPFCRGESDGKWIANIDWFLRPETIIRILEGFYDDRSSARTARVSSSQSTGRFSQQREVAESL